MPFPYLVAKHSVFFASWKRNTVSVLIRVERVGRGCSNFLLFKSLELIRIKITGKYHQRGDQNFLFWGNHSKVSKTYVLWVLERMFCVLLVPDFELEVERLFRIPNI